MKLSVNLPQLLIDRQVRTSASNSLRLRRSTSHQPQFIRQGHLFFPGLLNGTEVAILQTALPDILNRQGPEVISETERRGDSRQRPTCEAQSPAFVLLNRERIQLCIPQPKPQPDGFARELGHVGRATPPDDVPDRVAAE